MINQLTPVQLLLWIVGLELVSVPLIAFLVSWITNIIYKGREAHYLRIAKTIAKIIEVAEDKKEGSNQNGNDNV